MREMGYQSSKKNSQQPKEFRGGEKKVMKKRLALLLSVAMAFSMFANVAFGASSDLTTTQKYDALVKEGIFTGIAGSNDPQLNATTTRAQFAKVLALTLDLAPVNTGNSFKDQNYSKHWAKPYVEALVKENLITGYADGKFHFNDTVTGEQMAKTFGAALGLEEVKDAAAIEGVSKWAYGWVQAVKDAGFDWSENGKWNVPAKRATLVEASYDVREQTSVQVESAKAIDEKTVEVKFTDGETEKVTLDKALVEGQETTIKVEHKGKSYDVKVTLKALAVEAKATGVKKVEATLTRAVDTTKAKVEIKRGSSAITTKEVKFSDDNTSIQIETGSKMLEGEYTLTISGASEKAVSTTFKVEAEKVTKIELLSDKAAADKTFDNLMVGYRVLNQYGDDMSNTASINWNASKGSVSANNGRLTISNSINGATVGKYVLGETIVVTGVETNSTTTVTANLTVSTQSMLDKIEFKGLYNADKKELNTDSDFSTYYLLFDAYDQYGNKMSKTEARDGMIITSSNPTIADISVVATTYGDRPNVVDKVGPNFDSLGVALKNPANNQLKFDGKVTFRAITTGTGKQYSYDVDVKKASTVTKFTLQNPENTVASGETVKIPFAAYDQEGNEITSHKALNDKVTVSVTQGTIAYKKDAATGKFVLEYTAPTTTADTKVALTSIVKANGNSSQVLFDVRKSKYPQVVSGLKDFNANVGVNGETKLNNDTIKIQDQYGREMSMNDAIGAGYTLELKNNNIDYVAHSGLAITAKDGSITLTGKKKGFASFDLTLVKDGVAQSNSTYSFNVNVVDKADISDYVVEDIATIADQSVVDATYKDKYQVGLKVYGQKSNGERVVLSPSEYTVVSNINGLEYNSANKLVAESVSFGDKNEVKGLVTVTINASETPKIVNKEVTVSKAAPKAAEIKVGDKGGVVTAVDGNVFTVSSITNAGQLLQNLKVKDQYGVELPATQYTSLVTATVTNYATDVVSVTGNGGAATGVLISAKPEKNLSGQEFSIVFTINGQSQTVKVVVE
ncbi:S-layer homology domain-containing protein [Paenibacillus aquistagni]|uniref:S-layer homology domain-containing protein n=1 Tax=Paenibacillus aquistagni TaxID=1852522 RepID=A0A1X7KY83_9BACL|nr:S-layer homology domain-containing protein [Paenibacillus aquistagni]SMG45859.1 S-layer homology domain-containing protein [Paenibacillus aquistagni]